jgi:hypothetical protein
MLRWFRAQARSTAVAVLVSLTALGGWSSTSHGPDCHDADCVWAVRHEASAHAIQSAAADESHPLHCVLCHWTRSFRPSTDTVHHLATPVEGDGRIHTDVFTAALVFPAAQPSLRAPPAPPVCV